MLIGPYSTASSAGMDSNIVTMFAGQGILRTIYIRNMSGYSGTMTFNLMSFGPISCRIRCEVMSSDRKVYSKGLN